MTDKEIILYFGFIFLIFNTISIIKNKKFVINKSDLYFLIFIFICTFILTERNSFADYQGYLLYLNYVNDINLSKINEPISFAYFYWISSIYKNNIFALEKIYIINFVVFIAFILWISRKISEINSYIILLFLGATLAFVTLRATPAYILISLIYINRKLLINSILMIISVCFHYSSIIIIANHIFTKNKKFFIIFFMVFIIFFIYSFDEILGERKSLINIEYNFKNVLLFLFNIILLLILLINRKKINEFDLIKNITLFLLICTINTVIYIRLLFYLLLIFLSTNKINNGRFISIIKITSPFIYIFTFNYVMG